MKRDRGPTTGQKIAALIRIWRAAEAANDHVLQNAASAELSALGISTAELFGQSMNRAEADDA